MTPVVVFGGSGYTGLELLGLLAEHPKVKVVASSSDRWAGERIATRVLGFPAELRFETHGAALKAARKAGFAFLATPHETSLELTPQLLEMGLRVIDLSGAFRLEKTSDYPKWYGFKHTERSLLEEAIYGLPELFAVRAEERLVANPGCYATAAILALAPLVGGGLLERSAPIIIDGKSGLTGAGRKLEEGLLFSEIAETVRPYRLLKHQHTPEMERALSRFGRYPVQISFTPHLIPMRRGLIVSAYGRAEDGVSQRTIDLAFEAAYGKAPFVRVLNDGVPEPGRVLHTNFCEVAARYDERNDLILAFGALDNLVKGAAGQAIQNLNLLLGLPQETGLLPSPQGESP